MVDTSVSNSLIIDAWALTASIKTASLASLVIVFGLQKVKIPSVVQYQCTRANQLSAVCAVPTMQSNVPVSNIQTCSGSLPIAKFDS
jgi:hypothetical protein